jgi:cyclophilin family peptidyl-prolyl cis-trans isomerase
MASKNRVKSKSAGRNRVEPLEGRTLFNATITSAIADVSAAQNSGATTIDLSTHFSEPSVVGTAVVMHTTQGDIPMTLTDTQTPLTAANFLSYVNSGEYNGTVLQRAVPGFILQGGQFLPDGSQIPAGNPVASEAGIPNNTGTIAMALNSNGPGSATDAWFINLGNNSALNGSLDGGPFTVFGKVLYNGMNVVNQIVNLPKGTGPFPTIPGDPAGGSVPLQNFAGGTPTSANFVSMPSVQVVPKLAYNVTSDNTGLVVPSLSNGILTLNYVPGQSGVANIIVTATDLGGNLVTSTFKAAVGSVIGTGGAKLIRYTEGDHTAVTASLTGPGSATFQFGGSNVTQTLSRTKVLTVSGANVQVSSIALSGTTAASTLTITGAGGSRTVNIGAITSASDLRAINAPQAAVSGSMTFSGALGRLALGTASGGTITVSGTTGTLALQLAGAATGESINSTEAIASILAKSWTGASGATGLGTITAPSVSRINIRGEFDATITAGSLGPVTAGSIAAGAWGVTGSSSSVIAGSITGLVLHAASVGRVNSRGTISHSLINSSGNVTAVNALGLTGSEINAGTPTVDASGIATGFTTAAGIGSVTLGRSGFSNSLILASTLGRLTLGAIPSQNGGNPFGVAGHTIQSLTATVDGKRLALFRVTTQAQVAAALTKAGITSNNLVIRVV